jgi:hypothetical protein
VLNSLVTATHLKICPRLYDVPDWSNRAIASVELHIFRMFCDILSIIAGPDYRSGRPAQPGKIYV